MTTTKPSRTFHPDRRYLSELSDPVGQLQAEAENEAAKENEGRLVQALLGLEHSGMRAQDSAHPRPTLAVWGVPSGTISAVVEPPLQIFSIALTIGVTSRRRRLADEMEA